MKTLKRINHKKIDAKYGVTLIMLVVTIIVMSIIAGTAITFLNTDVMSKGKERIYLSDRDNMQDLLEVAMQKIVRKNRGPITLNSGIIDITTGEITWVSNKDQTVSGKIIFGEGTDTDTVFYTGNKLSDYGEDTAWYIISGNKIALRIEELEIGGDI